MFFWMRLLGRLLIFSDVRKFESSVLYWQRREGEENLSKQKRFRLKKILTKLRKGKTPVKRKSN